MKLLALLFVALGLQAQTDTLNSASVVWSTPVLPGINVAQPAYFGPAQFLKNLFGIVNPGMEGYNTNVIIRCGSGTTTTCVGANPNPYFDPANFLAGGSFYFPVAGANWTGPNTGCSGTISSTNGSGTYTFPACPASVVVDDYLAITKSGVSPTATSSGNYYGNYIVGISNSATVSIATGDLPSGVAGSHAMKVDASAGPTASVNIEADTDTGSNGPDVYVNGGNWTLSLWAKVASCTGTCTFTMNIQRAGSGGFNHSSGTITPTPNSTPNAGWQQYTVVFAGTENPAPFGAIAWHLSTSGQGVFWFKGLDFEQTTGIDVANTSIFRDVWVHKWQAYHPGTLRLDWNSGIRDTLADWLTPTVGRQMTGTLFQFPPTATGMGLDDFLRLCQVVGADPYFSIPNEYSTSEMSNLMDYLGGSSGTTYGAKRAALGQSAPWTSVFGKIHVEAGNENWNTSFPYTDMPALGANTYRAFGANCKRIFAAAKASASWTAGKFDFILGCQEGAPSNCIDAHNWDPNHDSVNQSGYNPVQQGSLTTVNVTTEWTSKLSEAWGYVHDTVNGSGSLLNAALLGSSRPVPWSVYEYRENNLGYGGGGTLAQLSTDVSALGSGLAEFVGTMEDLVAYNHPRNMWDAGDFSTGGAPGQIPLFGASVGVGGKNNRDRPGLVMQTVANAAIAGFKLVSSSIAGGQTFNSGAINGHFALNSVQYLGSYYFANGNNRVLILTNGDPSSSHVVTLAGDGLFGTVTSTTVNSTNITDTNEASALIVPSNSSFAAASTYTIPAHSMVTLAWNTAPANVGKMTVTSNGVSCTVLISMP